MKRRPRIAIDLDKTIAHYDGWINAYTVGEPLEGAVEFIRTLQQAGWYIYIFSARAEDTVSKSVIQEWVCKHFPFLLDTQKIFVTNVKSRDIECFVDDRAIPFWGDYEATLDYLAEYVKKKEDVKEALAERKLI